MLKWLLSVLACFAMLAVASFALAQDQPKHFSQCQAIAQNLPGATFARFDAGTDEFPPVMKAAAGDETVRITFIGHSTFYIETPAGVSIATDYNGYMKPPLAPLVATMNHAHNTHFTLMPDPSIRYVLHGWSDDPATKPDYHLVLRDTFIRNVTTDIRGNGGMERDGNSIFIFEVAGLCIGHLGHLHEQLSEGQYAEVGRLDVLMVPVDGGLTMGPAGMSNVVKRLRSSLILPMHMPGALDRFLAMFGPDFDVSRAETNTVEISARTLPKRPLFWVAKGMQW